MVHPLLKSIAQRIEERSQHSRQAYLDSLIKLGKTSRANIISCSNMAHTVAAMSEKEKQLIISPKRRHIGIITSYNDMLSAHQPYENYPKLIRSYCQDKGVSAQVASGVPAMCDGITQGRSGMELSLHSRDIIALSTSVGLAHEVFDGVVYLGICDKIVPGMLIGALQFGHLPSLFIPAGPMTSGISNQEKKHVRQQYIEKKVSYQELFKTELQAYHSPGTCTFYGTANSNQMLLEVMGLHRPNHAFINPHDSIKPALIKDGLDVLINAISQPSLGIGYLINVKSLINALITLLATGGSTNHTIHWIAVAKACGIKISWQDIADLSAITPQIVKMYPNGDADVNVFQEAGGPASVIRHLLNAQLLFEDVPTMNGKTLESQCYNPYLHDGKVHYQAVTESTNDQVIRTASDPFSPTGGITLAQGNLGKAIIKTSALTPQQMSITAPARVFDSPDKVIDAYQQGELREDAVIVVRNQGPGVNGMPELHKLMPVLMSLQSQGYHNALLTDGRLSGASGQALAAIHLVPESGADSPVSKIQHDDTITIDAKTGTLKLHLSDIQLGQRKACIPTESTYINTLFHKLRQNISPADEGASIW